MTNIAALSANLTRMPDDALVREMQSPSGSVPQFLVLTELQRRKQLRAGAGAGAPPSSTVAQDILGEQPRQAAPMMAPAGAMSAAPHGMGGMPTNITGAAPQHMASGGPVRMDMNENWYSGGYPVPAWYGEGQRGDRGEDTIMDLIGLDPRTRQMRDSGDGAPPLPPFATPVAPNVPNSEGGPYRFPAPPLPEIARPQVPQANMPEFSVGNGGLPDLHRSLKVSASRSVKNGGGASAASAGAPQSDGTSMDDMIGDYKKLAASGLFPEPQHNGEMDGIRALMDKQNESAPWLALSKAGFKMAGGTSPFFATNAGEGMAGISDDLQAQQTNYLKGKLELAGLSSREAEAEATRRVNMLNASMRFRDRQDSIAQRREDARGRDLDRDLQRQNQYEIARMRAAELSESRASRSDNKLGQLYGVLDSNYNRAVATAQAQLQKAETQWSKDHMVDAMSGKTSGLTLQDMPSWTSAERAREQVDAFQPKLFQAYGVSMPQAQGIKSVTPAAQKARTIDFNSLPKRR